MIIMYPFPYPWRVLVRLWRLTFTWLVLRPTSAEEEAKPRRRKKGIKYDH